MADDPLPLATYARALAHLLSHRDQPIEKVLGGLGLTMAQLHAADAHYNEQLGVAYRRRKGVLAMQFAQAFAEARRERGLFGAPPPPPAAPAPPSPAEVQVLPSYLSATPAAAAPVSAAPVSAPASPAYAPPPPAPISVPSPAPVSAPAPAPPSRAPAPPPGFGAASPPPPGSSSALKGTADLSPQQPAAPAVPFQPGAAPAPLPARSAQPAAPAPGTGTVLAPAEGPRGGEAPWDRSQVRERVGKLTLAHFAALTIEVGRNPPDLMPVLQRYGLSSTDDLRHVQAAFHAQMSVDPVMKSQFDALLARMRSMSVRS